jgi:predicted site-specific integrase-resolvase
VLGLAQPVNKQRCVVSGRVSHSPSACKPRRSLEQFCLARGLVVDVWVEASGGGLNVERKPLLALVDRIIAGSVGMLVLTHQDRLARFGFQLDLAIPVPGTRANFWC